MKKKLALALCAVMLLALAGCGKKECSICGKEKKCKTIELLGEEVDICNDCNESLETLGNLFK